MGDESEKSTYTFRWDSGAVFKEPETLIKFGGYAQGGRVVSEIDTGAFEKIKRVVDEYNKSMREAAKKAAELASVAEARIALEQQVAQKMERAAVAKARENLARLQQLCTGGCPQVAQLSAAISRGPTVAAAVQPDKPQTN